MIDWIVQCGLDVMAERVRHARSGVDDPAESGHRSDRQQHVGDLLFGRTRCQRRVMLHGGKYVREGRWLVPARIALRTRECRVTLGFSDAVITSRTLHIDADMVHGKLLIVSTPGIVIDPDGLTCTYSKLKLHTKHDTADSRLRVEFAGTLLHAKIIEKRP